MKKVLKRALMVLVLSAPGLPALASNLANPAFVLPPARLSFGGSYHVGGYLLTNDKVPSILNRINVSCAFDPLRYFDIGIDAGATQMEVASFASGTDTIDAFHGDYRFSAGGHLKLSTPFFFKNYLACIAIAQASFFSSVNKHDAEYSGIDGAGAVGLQVRIPQFGFVSGGAKVYLIDGENKGFDGNKGTYSNVNNLRGWLAVDCVPDLKGDFKGKPYFSCEVSVAPDVEFGNTVPISEIAFSISVGWISPRLYGPNDEDEEIQR